MGGTFKWREEEEDRDRKWLGAWRGTCEYSSASDTS